MKKLLLSFVLFFCILPFCNAQVDTVRLRDKGIKHTIVTDRPPQAVYFQLGGAGPILSTVYDRRFSKKVNGAGIGVGLGFWGESGDFIFSIPVSLNYLFGKQTHFIELAAGTTFLTNVSSYFDETSSGFIHHINLGYRHQPTTGGFFFRGGFSPLFFEGEYATSFYLGFGYNF